MNVSLLINGLISVGAYFLTVNLIPNLKAMFLKANIGGVDMSKRKAVKIPEAQGVVTGCVLLISLFVFIPVPFGRFLFLQEGPVFPHHEFVELIAALLSICCMTLLGFADDVLDLRWRHKLLLPTISSLPLLMVYFVNFNSTTVVLPNFVRGFLGFSIDIGCLYYIFMGMLAVFCTNAINILAGINGLEVSQSLVIAASVIVFNTIEMMTNESTSKAHQFSLYFMMPYFATTLALWKFNKYPSQVFVGDTFNYLSGMTFAVVGILGHFSKTLLLFFIPQIINFIYSVPQLFHFIPCPRHRLPKYDPETDLLSTSKTTFKLDELSVLGKLSYYTFKTLRLIQTEEKDGVAVTNNFTIINFAIVLGGPTHERTLNQRLVAFQVLCTCIAFAIRYPLAKYFYES